MKTVSKIAAMIACTACFPMMVHAASDGDIGTTSTGTADITLEIEELIVVSGMQDFEFGSWSGGALSPIDHDITIAGNDDQSTPEYTVTLTGSGTANAFTIQRDTPASPTHDIAYTVTFNDEAGTSGATSVTAGTPLTGQTGIHTVLTTSTANANIEVSFAQGALEAAPYGTYEGLLTLVAEPE